MSTVDGEFTYFNDPQVDRVVGLIWQLAQELSVTRNRLLVLEELLRANGVIAPEAVDGANLDTAATARITADRKAMVSRLVRVLTEADDHDSPMRAQFVAQLADAGA